MHQNEWYQVWFLKIVSVEGFTKAPYPDHHPCLPSLFSGFALSSCSPLNSRARRALDSVCGLNSRALSTFDSGFALNCNWYYLIAKPTRDRVMQLKWLYFYGICQMIPTNRPNDRPTDRPADQNDRPTDRSTDRPTDRPIDRPINRRTGQTDGADDRTDGQRDYWPVWDDQTDGRTKCIKRVKNARAPASVFKCKQGNNWFHCYWFIFNFNFKYNLMLLGFS